MKNILILSITFLFTITSGTGFFQTVTAQKRSNHQQFYQIKIYHLDDNSQEQKVDAFLKEAYLPALHRAGVEPVGVFKPIEQDTTSDRRIYVLTPFNSLEQLITLQDALEKDNQYLSDGASYIRAQHNQPPYAFIESIILKAFSQAPHIQTPDLTSPKPERIYELRSYGSATEALNKNKVEMFNEGGEVEIFKDLEFNAVFYGNVLAGSEMPNLMYMTSFKNMESREAHWDSFVNSPQWEKLSSVEKYQHNVSRINIQLLHPTKYSDL